MDILDMEGQTAPESTRGLFDPPQEPKSSARKCWSDDKRHSALELSNAFNEDPSSHPRSKSATFTVRPSLHQHRSALHTVSEEGDGTAGGRYGKRLDDPISLQRKHRSSALFNNFPMGSMGQMDSQDPDDDDDAAAAAYSRADVLAEAEAKLTGAYPNRGRPTQQQQQSLVLTEGYDRRRYKADDLYQDPQQQQHQQALFALQKQQKYNRRLSEPSTRPSYYRHSSDVEHYDSQQRRSLSNYGHQNKRTSLQWSPSHYDDEYSLDYRRATAATAAAPPPAPPPPAGKAGGLTLDITRSNRRSSHNYGVDWRASNASMVSARSPTSNRSSCAWVPFTPTNVTFPREDQQLPQQQQRRALFVAHLPFSALVPLLKKHQLVSGILRVNKRNRSDAYVFCEELNADIYICGSRDRNRALEGDVVAIKLVEVEKVIREKQEKEQAKVMRNNGQPIVRKPDEEDEKEIMFGGEEDVDKVKPKYCGVVVAILERPQTQVFSGTLGLTRPSNKRSNNRNDNNDDDDSHSVRSDASPRIVWFKPTDKRVPLIAIPVEQAPQGFLECSQQFENRLFLGSIKRWPITSLHPFGVLESELGHVTDLIVQSRAILADNNFSFEPFSDPIMRSLPPTPWSLTDDMIHSRLDLRAIRSITIAGDGALDNALSIQRKNDNLYEVGFHVADLSVFVKPHSPLDKEAKARAAALYLYESAPLWPEQLLHECVNFVPRSARLAFSVSWKLDQSGKVLDIWYGRTVIESHGVLTTSELQDILDGNGIPDHISIGDHEKPEWEDDINMLYSLSQSLKQARRRDGALFLSKQKINIDINQDGSPKKISLATRFPAEDIMDEFKILVNTGVAQKISSHFPDHALLQSQAPPNERKLRELARYLRGLGYTIDPSTAQNLQQTVDGIENEAAKTVITTLALKTMYPSKFFCTGKFDINRYYHYNLNAPLYTQFTSPTRCYADLIVHRQLEAVLAGDKRFYLESEIIQKIARHCNVKGLAAENAREQSQHLFMSRYLIKLGSTATTHEAIVVGVQDQAFDVMVPDMDLERRIHVINLPLETHKYSPADGVLHLFWKTGVATADTMAEQADAMAELEEEEEEDVQLSPTISAPPSTTADHLASDAVHELSIKSVSSPPSAEQPFKRRPRSMSLRVVEGENPWTSQQECTIPDESRQVIRPFDYIRVVITSDPDRSPPLIRVLAANPFV